MKKLLFIFIAMFLTVPAAARVCMADNPTTIMTKTEVAALESRIAEMEGLPADISWFSSWSSASGTLANSSVSNVSNNWQVTSDQSGATQTVRGEYTCSETSGVRPEKGDPSDNIGGHLWCRMTYPRVGAWVFNSGGDSDYGMCIVFGRDPCGQAVRQESAFRAAVLSLP